MKKYIIGLLVTLSVLNLNAQSRWTSTFGTGAANPLVVPGNQPLNSKEWYVDTVVTKPIKKWRPFAGYLEAINWLPTSQRFMGIHAYIDSTGTNTNGVVTGGVLLQYTYDANLNLVYDGTIGVVAGGGVIAGKGIDVTSGIVSANFTVASPSLSVVGAGDSWTNNAAFPTILGVDPQSYLNIVERMSTGKIFIVNNAGHPGFRSDSILGRISTDVLAFNPQMVFLLAGINDNIQGIAPSVTIANIAEYVDICRSNRIDVTLFTIPGNNGSYKPNLLILNAAIRKLATQKKCRLVDLYSVVSNPATGGLKTYYTYDNLHENQQGARQTALAVLAEFGMLPSMRTSFPLATSASEAANLVSNPLYSNATTGITNSSNPGYGTIATETDTAILGNWLAINKTDATKDVTILQALTASVPVGNRLQITGRVQSTGFEATNGTVNLYVNNTGATAGGSNLWPLNAVTIDINKEGIFHGECVVPAGTTSQIVAITITGGTGKLRLAQLRVTDLTATAIGTNNKAYIVAAPIQVAPSVFPAGAIRTLNGQFQGNDGVYGTRNFLLNPYFEDTIISSGKGVRVQSNTTNTGNEVRLSIYPKDSTEIFEKTYQNNFLTTAQKLATRNMLQGKLVVSDSLRLPNAGTPASGYVLTSVDNLGNARWAAPASGGGTTFSTDTTGVIPLRLTAGVLKADFNSNGQINGLHTVPRVNNLIADVQQVDSVAKNRVVKILPITNGFRVYYVDSTPDFVFSGGSGTSYFAASGNNIYNTNTGNVGIGIGANDASAKLEVYSPSGTTAVRAASGTNTLIINGSGLSFQAPTAGFVLSSNNTSVITGNATQIEVNAPNFALLNPTKFQYQFGAGAGKVLTSDASGNATWQTATGGSSTGPTSYPTSSTPADPASGAAVVWFDGTYLRVKKNVGGTITQAIIY